ncbi:MAG: hypothetical protein OIF54_00780, partial [Cohaesibacter sp.]|nr:hypothetical protein [Cohaesibacter sp.]
MFFVIMAAASAAAFFCASQACRVLSATNLPAATRLGFFAGFVVGVGEFACCVISPCKFVTNYSAVDEYCSGISSNFVS